MKKYNLQCSCGMVRSIPHFILMLRFIRNEKVYFRCPECGMVKCLRLVSHIVHDSTDAKEKELNKIKHSKEVWRKC